MYGPKKEYLAHRNLEEHVASPLHTEKLARNPDDVRVQLVGCT